jgi:LPXTG-site transpeptidase (sortase) family protein
MTSVHLPRIRQASWRGRIVATSLMVVLAAGAGVLVANVQPDDEVGAITVAAQEPVDLLSPITDSAISVVDGLSATLPVPEPSPLDAWAPTPTVRHGMLEIPSIGLSQPFFEGVTLTAIDNGPSHWPGSAMPGEMGNVVIAGHRVTRTRPFYDLDLAKPGDEMIFTMDSGERYVYILDRIEIVDADALHIVDQVYGYKATIFGCHPKHSVRQRIVGHFTLKSSPEA